MREVAIIGAGELGGALAHLLARHDTAREVRLIDGHGRVAEGKALDIAQAAPIESFSTSVSGTTDLLAAAGAAIVVVADPIGGGEPQGEEGLTLIGRVAAVAPRAVVVCADAGARLLVERGVRERHVDRRRLFGTAPEALAAAARALVAVEADASAGDVALTVLGAPPDHIVVPWTEATVGGFSATGVLDEPARRRVIGRLPWLWPPGPYALAAAAATAIDVMLGRSRRMTSCFVAADDSAGTRARAVALPVRLAAAGIADVVIPALTPHDRVALDNAMLL